MPINIGRTVASQAGQSPLRGNSPSPGAKLLESAINLSPVSGCQYQYDKYIVLHFVDDSKVTHAYAVHRFEAAKFTAAFGPGLQRKRSDRWFEPRLNLPR